MGHFLRLKRCPFCGAFAQAQPWHGGEATKIMISCSADACDVGPQVTGETPAQAMGAWNKRSRIASRMVMVQIEGEAA